MENLIIGDIVKIKHHSMYKDYVWNNHKARVEDVYKNYIVLRRDTDYGEYRVCIGIPDIICKDVEITVYRGGKKWRLDYLQ